MTEAFCRFVLKQRWPVLALLLVATAYMAVMATTVKVESNTIDLFPSTHPYVETFKKYADVFGGASVWEGAEHHHSGGAFDERDERRMGEDVDGHRCRELFRIRDVRAHVRVRRKRRGISPRERVHERPIVEVDRVE